MRVCNKLPQPPPYISFLGVVEDYCMMSSLHPSSFLYLFHSFFHGPDIYSRFALALDQCEISRADRPGSADRHMRMGEVKVKVKVHAE